MPPCRVVTFSPERSGLTDYLSPDGELALSPGLAQPVLPAMPDPEAPDCGENADTPASPPPAHFRREGLVWLCAHIHGDPSVSHIYSASDGSLMAADGEGEPYLLPFPDQARPVADAAPVDDILCVAGADGMHFLRRRDGSYSCLGDSLPAPEPDFSLRRVALAPHTGAAGDLPVFNVAAGDKEASAATAFAMRFDDDAAGAGLFTTPLLAICVLRLADGSHAMPSPPQMLIPNAGRVCVSRSDLSTAETAVLTLHRRSCALGMRLAIDGAMEKWSGIVAGVDVFVATLRAGYDAETVSGLQTLPSADADYSLSGLTFGCEEPLRNVEQARLRGYILSANGPAEMAMRLAAAADFHRILSIDADEVTGYADYVDLTPYCRPHSRWLAAETYTPDYSCYTRRMPTGCSSAAGRLTAWGGSRMAPAPVGSPRLAPRFIFHPDPEATCCEISSFGVVSLSRHPTLYGSYAVAAFAPLPISETPDGGLPIPSSVATPNLLMTSRIGSPFIFPLGNTVMLPCGEIKGVAAAMRSSLSTAYGGGFLLAFTSEGVSLLGARDDSTHTPLGFLGARRLLSHRSLAVTAEGTAFAADGGIFLVGSGSIKEITGNLTAIATDEPSAIPDAETVMVYDFPSRSLYLLTGSHCYCRRETDGKWRTADDDPSRLPVQTAKPSQVSFATRAIKLGDAESLKRVTGVELRGRFDGSRCSMTLEGSDDLSRWFLLASGGGAIHGLAGSAWHFFRLKVCASLTPGDYISAAVFYLAKQPLS